MALEQYSLRAFLNVTHSEAVFYEYDTISTEILGTLVKHPKGDPGFTGQAEILDTEQNKRNAFTTDKWAILLSSYKFYSRW